MNDENKIYWEKRRRNMARAEERTNCKKMDNDPERIQQRIEYLRLHLEELTDIAEKQDFFR